jgi:hypothetical protein
MDKIEYVPVDEALSAKKTVKKQKTILEVESKLNKLPEGKAGKIVIKTEKPQTVRNRVIKVAKSLGMTDLKVKKSGDAIYFYKK